MSTIGHPGTAQGWRQYTQPLSLYKTTPSRRIPRDELAAELLDQVGNLLGLRELGVDLGGAAQAGQRVVLLAQLGVGQAEVVLDLAVGRRPLLGLGQDFFGLHVRAAAVVNPAQGVGHLGRARGELGGRAGARLLASGRASSACFLFSTRIHARLFRAITSFSFLASALRYCSMARSV